ncbi:hypothetical protein COCCADRAFT_21736 [Bipolaris zeicola 26-R-13]|uniref:Uncharacterized protein n=1 Tax=Cochliobolus carbonum (strain 26-R-13) TaxID=930089 RepID=W6YMG0_COCC2|nr:uncharacterized protein COCCADRAFT_21736 [Bipolaris zeicola 26-R-13]EUC39005.1 hypothetical protein COCCADRAFT_21736 [Bipolaris zeicola 26-R-13]
MGEGLKKQDTGSKRLTWQPRRSLWNGAVARARRQLLAPVLASVRSETLVRRDRAPISKSDRPELALLQPWGVSSALPLADVAGQTAIVAGNQFARARRRACRVWWWMMDVAAAAAAVEEEEEEEEEVMKTKVGGGGQALAERRSPASTTTTTTYLLRHRQHMIASCYHDYDYDYRYLPPVVAGRSRWPATARHTQWSGRKADTGRKAGSRAAKRRAVDAVWSGEASVWGVGGLSADPVTGARAPAALHLHLGPQPHPSHTMSTRILGAEPSGTTTYSTYLLTYCTHSDLQPLAVALLTGA